MSILYLSLLALSLSADTFAASLGQGAVAAHDAPMQRGLATAGVFALFQAIMPALGWQLGGWSQEAVAGDYWARLDHWLVFGLLTVIAIGMVRSGPTGAPRRGFGRGTLPLLALMAFVTSVDSLGAGLGLGLLEAPLFSLVAMIGGVTFVTSFAGFVVGRMTGQLAWFPAHVFAGLTVFAVGLGILADHGAFAALPG